MNLLAVWTELEDDKTWRRNEIRFLLNQAAEIPREADRDRFRRAAILLLYAHFEGFCKTALLSFVRAVNQESVPCSCAQPAFIAATCERLLRALADPNSKSEFFRSKAPDDSKLHRSWRFREFVQGLDQVLAKPVEIPEDLVDTESNLWPVVLEKILFSLGFDPGHLKVHHGKIWSLVNQRNDISHGMARSGVSRENFQELQQSVYEVMDEVMKMVLDSLHRESFRAVPAFCGSAPGEPSLPRLPPPD